MKNSVHGPFFRILRVMTVIKYWSMYHKLSGNDGNRWRVINNYAVVMMVIFYFQNQHILPSVNKLQRQLKNPGSK